MKEHLTSFSRPMIIAINEGRKTQTRRRTPDQILTSYFDKAPEWLMKAYQNDAVVHRAMKESAIQRDSTEKMLWRMAKMLLETKDAWEEQCLNRAMISPIPPFVG